MIIKTSYKKQGDVMDNLDKFNKAYIENTNKSFSMNTVIIIGSIFISVMFFFILKKKVSVSNCSALKEHKKSYDFLNNSAKKIQKESDKNIQIINKMKSKELNEDEKKDLKEKYVKTIKILENDRNFLMKKNRPYLLSSYCQNLSNKINKLQHDYNQLCNQDNVV